MFRTHSRTVKLTVAVALSAGLFTSGCGQVRAGAAALVGDERITMSELSQTVEAAERSFKKQGAPVSDRAGLVRYELSRKIRSTLYAKGAARSDIDVSRGDVDRWIGQAGGRQRVEAQALQRYAVPPGELKDFARNQVILQQLSQSLAGSDPQARQTALADYLNEVARDTEITVNPRYGSFDMRQLAVAPEQGTLSTPDGGPSQPGLAPSGGRG